MKNLDIATLAVQFWYAEWKQALIKKHFDYAKECWKAHLLWKRREKVEEMLNDICETKNFGGVYDR